MSAKAKPVVIHISKWHTNWIIGGIFREAAEARSMKPCWRVYPTSKKDFLNLRVMTSKMNPQIGELNIYAHQDTFFSVLSKTPEQIWGNRNRVYFTHFNNVFAPTEEQIASLNECERILVQNAAMEQFLVSQGVARNKIYRIPGAVDRGIFHPSSELPKQNFVLFSGDFKYRKNPDLIARVISAMSDVHFVVHGRNWEIFPLEFLSGLPNLRKIDFEMVDQPELMRQASLYVSLATIEGGPYPVLEALASGTPVVATDTGFCAEFINESNGCLLPNPPELELVITSIRQALKLKQIVWNQDQLNGEWQWEDLGGLIFA